MITENKFEWTDELVREFMCELLWNKNIHGEKPKDFSVGVGNSSFLMEEFKKSKQQNTIQRDWEIMSFRVKDRNIILEKGEDGIFGIPMFCTDENDLIKSSIHEIHSVKRISDGQVFSVGDIIEIGFCDIDKGSIDRFEINYFDNSKISAWHRAFGKDIKHLNKVKQPLFKTEDGKSICKGDSLQISI